MGVGAGEAGGTPPAASLICDYVPLKRRSGAFAIYGVGPFIGITLGMALSGWLNDAIGWRWTFVALGLPGILFAAIVWLTVREPTRGRLDEVEDDRTGASLRETVVVLCRCRTYRRLLLTTIVGGFVNFGFYQWLPSFYTRTLGLDLSSAGAYLGMIIGVSSGIGVLTGGWVANKASQRDVGLPLRLSSMAIILALPAALGTVVVSSGFTSLLMLSLAVLLWCLPSGALVASLYSVTMPRMRATAGAIQIFATSVLGIGLGPLCVGLLSDLLTPSFGSEALRYALLVPIGVTPLMAILFYAAGKTLAGDLRVIGAKVGGPQ
jgi:predicted MFS family arabinose efflux permease